MSTDYTVTVGVVNESFDFNDYIINCAKRFGFLSHISGDDEIEYYKAQKYYTERFNEVSLKIEELEKMTISEKEEYGKERKNEELKFTQSMINSHILGKRRCENMLEKVRAWNPPSEISFVKDFAENQLIRTIEFDFNQEKYNSLIKHYENDEARTPTQVWEEKVKLYKDELVYLSSSIEREKKKEIESNLYIDKLLDSLSLDKPTKVL